MSHSGWCQRMSFDIKAICHHAKDILFSIVNREFLIFCFFLILSSGFWLSMTLDETYEREFSVPVSLVNIPDNVILNTELDDTLSFTLSDKGFAMIGYMHGKRLHPVTVDFHTYANRTKGKGVIPVTDVQNMVSRMLLSSTRIVSISPDRMEYSFSYATSKMMPVNLMANVTTAKNRYLLATIITPDSVKVYADKSMLRSTSGIPTEEIDVTELKDSAELVVPLKHASGVKCIPDTVRVVLKADAIVERSVDVPIRTINVPKGKSVSLLPDHIKVSYTIGAAVADRVKAEQFRVAVNYNDIVARPTEPCKLLIIGSPQQAGNVRLDDVKVTYLLEQKP